MPPNNNVLGQDPLLVDPENGNYQVQFGTAAEDYGCQIFGESRQSYSPSLLPVSSAYRDTLYVGGVISESTDWNAQTVLITDDVLVESEAILSIQPGTNVIFEDYYKLQIQGTLLAEGTADERISFSPLYGFLFAADSSAAGAWGGIYFENETAAMPTSRISFCVIENAKALEASQSEFNTRAGGAIRAYDYSDLIISNNIIRNNLAFTAGAIFCYKNSNPIIFGNLIHSNYALENVAAIYCGYSYPRIYNNTIVDNFIDNQDPYVETCAVKSFLSKPQIYNNIIRDNDANIPYIHQQMWEAKEFYTHTNNIQDLIWENGNLDQDPEFIADGEWEYLLDPLSICVDNGTDALEYLAETDLLGNPRIIGGSIDMGCFEASPTSAEAEIYLPEIIARNYPNPINLSAVNEAKYIANVKIELSGMTRGISPEKLKIYNLKGQLVRNIDLSQKNTINWDVRDEFGNFVSAGVYLYQIKIIERSSKKQVSVMGKIAVIK